MGSHMMTKVKQLNKELENLRNRKISLAQELEDLGRKRRRLYKKFKELQVKVEPSLKKIEEERGCLLSRRARLHNKVRLLCQKRQEKEVQLFNMQYLSRHFNDPSLVREIEYEIDEIRNYHAQLNAKIIRISKKIDDLNFKELCLGVSIAREEYEVMNGKCKLLDRNINDIDFLINSLVNKISMRMRKV